MNMMTFDINKVLDIDEVTKEKIISTCNKNTQDWILITNKLKDITGHVIIEHYIDRHPLSLPVYDIRVPFWVKKKLKALLEATLPDSVFMIYNLTLWEYLSVWKIKWCFLESKWNQRSFNRQEDK